MKIFEAAVNSQLRDFLVANNILTEEQSGFRAKHSTSSTLLDDSDYILNKMSNDMVTNGIYLDLKKKHLILLIIVFFFQSFVSWVSKVLNING